MILLPVWYLWECLLFVFSSFGGIIDCKVCCHPCLCTQYWVNQCIAIHSKWYHHLSCDQPRTMDQAGVLYFQTTNTHKSQLVQNVIIVDAFLLKQWHWVFWMLLRSPPGLSIFPAVSTSWSCSSMDEFLLQVSAKMLEWEAFLTQHWPVLFHLTKQLKPPVLAERGVEQELMASIV